MTPKEFKAWFEGFTEAIVGMPTEAQWKKVKERVSQIDGNPVSYSVYVDRYWPRPRPYWESPYWVRMAAGGTGGMTLSCAQSYEMLDSSPRNLPQPPFDSQTAMYAAGRADFDEARAA